MWSSCRCRARSIFDGLRLPASYANFYIGNAYVLVPTFNDPERSDRRWAFSRTSSPDRTVVGIHAVDLVWGFGTLHCLTPRAAGGAYLEAIKHFLPCGLGSRTQRRSRPVWPSVSA